MPGSRLLCGGLRPPPDGFAYYECSSQADLMNTPTCRSITADTVDNAVAGRLLGAPQP